MTTHGQKNQKMREQLPISCQLPHWCGLWEASRELPPPPFGLPAPMLRGRKTKRATYCEKNHFSSPSWYVPKGPFQKRKVHLLTVSTPSASSISHIGIQISSFSYYPLFLRDFKFQPLFQSSQPLCISQAVPPADWVQGSEESWEEGKNMTIPSFLVPYKSICFGEV